MINQSKLIKIFQKTNGKCFYCNTDNNLEVDHFVSKQKYKDWELEEVIGSPDKLENLFLACQKCNRQKRDKCPEDFIGNSYKCWNRYNRANKRIIENYEIPDINNQ